MRHDESQPHLIPNDRLHAVASLFADGILRLRGRDMLAAELGEPSDTKNLPDSDHTALEVCSETGLTVHNG